MASIICKVGGYAHTHGSVAEVRDCALGPAYISTPVSLWLDLRAADEIEFYERNHDDEPDNWAIDRDQDRYERGIYEPREY